MKHVRRILTIVLCAVVVGIGLTLLMQPKSVNVETSRVTRGPLMVTVNEDGKTRVKERYLVSAPLSGVLGRVEFHPGDLVQANQTVLVTIEPTDPALLDARTLAEAESRVKAAEAAKQQASARLEAAREAHALAEHELTRAQGLMRTNALSQAEFDATEHQEHIAQASLRAADFGDRVATFELQLARAALVRTRPDRSDKATADQLEIRSPVSGRVLRVLHESSAVVAPGQQLLEIGDTQEIEIEVDVLSTDAIRIKPGAKVFLEQWGGTDALSARVRLIEPSGFTKISALGVEEQRVNVIAEFNDPAAVQQGLGDGYRVDVRIVVWESENVLKVPSGALFRSGNDWAVFAVKNGRAELRKLTVGHMNGDEAEVIEGVAMDDELIVFPSDNIRPGVRVTNVVR